MTRSSRTRLLIVLLVPLDHGLPAVAGYDVRRRVLGGYGRSILTAAAKRWLRLQVRRVSEWQNALHQLLTVCHEGQEVLVTPGVCGRGWPPTPDADE